MSVYTSVSDEEMRLFLENYDLGDFVSLKGIAQGITNTNYFVSTTQDRYVLTIFEELKAKELPFFLELMRHLNENGVACPKPIAQKNQQLAAFLHQKPACLVSTLNGKDTNTPNETQCFNVGAMLAKMHLASTSFTQSMPNPRAEKWWHESVIRLYPHLSEKDTALLQEVIAFLDQNPDTHLPQGIIHADLFKDNVLLDGDQVAGFIDFYYASTGSFIYDIAIAINDWAQTETHTIIEELKQAFLAGYQSVRTLSDAELAYLPIAHKAGCIRFWVSRLLDFHFPPEGELTFTKNPNAFGKLLSYFNQESPLN